MEIDLFLFLLACQWPWYLLALAVSTAVMLPLLLKYSLTWFDPLRYSFIFAIFANAVPLFLWFVDGMETDMFIYFLLSEGVFWLGFLIWSRKRLGLSDTLLKDDETYACYFFYIAFTLYVLFTLIIYLSTGIPLFMSDKNHLSAYEGSGGVGLFFRLNKFLSIYCLVYVFHLLHHKKRRLLCYSVIAVIAVFLVLSASKSAFLSLLYAYFGYSFFYLKKKPYTAHLVWYVSLGVLAALFILVFQVIRQGGNAFDSIVALVTRFIASGDCYFYAYPFDTYKLLEVGNPWLFLSSGVLAAARFMPPEDVLPSLGVQLAWIVVPSTIGVTIGPNSRMPILSYALFGWWGILFALVAGVAVSWLVYRLPRFLPSGLMATAFTTYTYTLVVGGVTDCVMMIGWIFDFLINFALMMGLLFLCYYFLPTGITRLHRD